MKKVISKENIATAVATALKSLEVTGFEVGYIVDRIEEDTISLPIIQERIYLFEETLEREGVVRRHTAYLDKDYVEGALDVVKGLQGQRWHIHAKSVELEKKVVPVTQIDYGDWLGD